MKIHKKYHKLWKGNTRYYLVTGGRGSGKSFAVNNFIEHLTFQKGHTILFTRYTLVSAGKSIIPEFVEKIDLQNHNEHFKITNNEVINTKTNSKVIFSGIKTSSGNQTANLKSLQGITTWVLDEAEELTDPDVFDRIDLSVRQTGIQNRVIIVMNPTFKSHWIYKRWFEKPQADTTYIHTTYQDNRANLSESFIKTIENLKLQDNEAYRHKILGEWINNYTGLMYPELKMIDDAPYGESVLYCDTADTGQDYLCSVQAFRTDSGLYVNDVIYTKQPNEITEIEVAKQIQRNGVNRAIIESNNGGRAFARNVERILKEQYNYNAVRITTHHQSKNKVTRILSNSSQVVNNVYFCKSVNVQFLNDMRTFTRDGKNNHDDAPDATTGLVEHFMNSNELIVI